jgi:hypothetical protein
MKRARMRRHSQEEDTYLTTGVATTGAAKAFDTPTRRTLARNERIRNHRAQAATARSDELEPIIGLGPVGLIPVGRRICTTLPTEVVVVGVAGAGPAAETARTTRGLLVRRHAAKNHMISRCQSPRASRRCLKKKGVTSAPKQARHATKHVQKHATSRSMTPRHVHKNA